MLTIFYSNGEMFVYDADDWVILRKQHRIVGQIIGNSNHIPSLPLKILPEEAYLLCHKKLADIRILPKTIRDVDETKIREYEDTLLQAQIEEYRKIRKTQLLNMIDKIVEKRRKLDDNRSVEEILNEELEKSTTINKANMIWPILSVPSDLDISQLQILTEEALLERTTKLKQKVFSDLWERGFYVTEGSKFGGDYLVYYGDPVCHHAIFIIKCVDNSKNISPSEIVTMGRLGTSVKKKAVLASLVNDEVSYITVNWIDA
ncbi:unnamed protein product [Phaedon cochleariae]|uniref:tRNA-splicing endonuclease subunit Sen34 n=1 Tax=Phaedon cochleariae TaxID=80249 RepID=A0A9P0DCM8_PHACE|nr:unnamed protein product [Phaedon cochleariae]